jgi:hypothetical protein
VYERSSECVNRLDLGSCGDVEANSSSASPVSARQTRRPASTSTHLVPEHEGPHQRLTPTQRSMSTLVADNPRRRRSSTCQPNEIILHEPGISTSLLSKRLKCRTPQAEDHETCTRSIKSWHVKLRMHTYMQPLYPCHAVASSHPCLERHVWSSPRPTTKPLYARAHIIKNYPTS